MPGASKFNLFKVNPKHRCSGKQTVILESGTSEVISVLIEETSGGSLYSLFLLLSNGHMTYDLVAREIQIIYSCLDFLCKYRGQYIPSFGGVYFVFEFSLQYCNDDFLNLPWVESSVWL